MASRRTASLLSPSNISLTFVGDPAAAQISQRLIPAGNTVRNFQSHPCGYSVPPIPRKVDKKLIINPDKTPIPLGVLDSVTYDIRGNGTINSEADRG